MTTSSAAASKDRLPIPLVAAGVALTVLPLLVEAAGGLTTPSAVSGAIVHDLLEWSVVCVALFTAALGLLYVSARPDYLVYTVTLAAIACAIWDGLHTAVSTGLVGATSDLEDFIPFTYAVGRTLRAVILTVGTAYVALGGRYRSMRWSGVAALCLGLGVAALAAFSFLLRTSLPRALFADSLVSRPWDLPALGLFLLDGLVLYPLLVRRRPSVLARTLLLAAAAEVLASFQMAFGSKVLYDAPFLAAHVLKLVAAVLPLSGLCLDLVRSYRREMAAVESMEHLVSDLKTAEDELRQREQRFRQLTENLREVFWLSSADGSEMIYASPAYERIFGLSAEALYRDPADFLAVIHPNDRATLQALLETFVDTEFEVDYRILRHDGEVRWLRTRGFPIRDERGAIYRVAGVTEDVTARKQAEEELKKSEARTRALLRAMPDLMFRVSRSGLILDYHAQPFARLYKPPSVFLGARIQDLFPGLGDSLLERIQEVMTSGIVQSFEYRLEIDGQVGDYECRFAPTSDEEVLTVVRDVTEQKRLQREILDISNREQERIGHDLHDGISQQLTGIAMLLKVLHGQLVSRGLPEAERARQIESLVEESLAQTRILARGLAPVEIDAGGLPAALEDLARGVEKVHKIRCSCHCDPGLAVGSPAEAVHLYRIAQEAVTNALRHASPTRILIELTSSQGRLRLSVQDDGTGIPHPPSATQGMGLHIMRYRARMIDGTLDIRPAPRGGTIVTCDWSYVTEAEPQVPWV